MLKDMISVDPKTLIESVLHSDFVFVSVQDDSEEDAK